MKSDLMSYAKEILGEIIFLSCISARPSPGLHCIRTFLFSPGDLLLSQSKDVSRVKYDVEADEDEATFNLMSPFSPSLAY